MISTTFDDFNPKVAFAGYLQKLEKIKRLSLEEQLRLTRFRQQIDLLIQLDTLQQSKHLL